MEATNDITRQLIEQQLLQWIAEGTTAIDALQNRISGKQTQWFHPALSALVRNKLLCGHWSNLQGKQIKHFYLTPIGRQQIAVQPA